MFNLKLLYKNHFFLNSQFIPNKYILQLWQNKFTIHALPPLFFIDALSLNTSGILNGADPNGSDGSSAVVTAAVATPSSGNV